MRILLLHLLIFPHLANAYTFTISADEIPLRWEGDQKINFVGNPQNSSGLSADDFRKFVVRSLQRWNIGSSGGVSFDYWQGSDEGVFQPNSELNGRSSIYFVSNLNEGDPGLTSSIIAITQVWFDSGSGEILESDIVLNDRDYRFTNDPADTTGFGGGGGGFGFNVYAEGVITHELGHAYGLSHSGSLQSSMFFMEAPDQVHLACDDMVGIQNAYPDNADTARGEIRGRVLSESGDPLFGAYVVAISTSRGVPVTGALTDRDGEFRIEYLEEGNYVLMIEPFSGGSNALPEGYSGINSRVCRGRSFGRTFVTEGSNNLRVYRVSESDTTDVDNIFAKCGSGGATVEGPFGGSRESNAPTIANGNGDFAVVDRVSRAGDNLYYYLQDVSGPLQISLNGYSLYSPVALDIELSQVGGGDVRSVRKETPVYRSETGFVNHDTTLTINNLSRGDYILTVETSSLSTSNYPAGGQAVDSVPFFAIHGRFGTTLESASRVYPAHPRCRISDSQFPAYSSPNFDPPEGDTGTGFCGSVNRNKNSVRKNKSFSSAEYLAIAGWWSPWLAIVLSLFGIRIAVSGWRPYRKEQ